ncbi:MAG: hypothetical protein ACK5KL_19385 [Dysgonomonas sp.]
MAKKEIGKGFDGMFKNAKPDNKPEVKENEKEKLFCTIDAELKKRLLLHKVNTKESLNTIVENALSEYLDKNEKEK